jgi:hypothetical protein
LLKPQGVAVHIGNAGGTVYPTGICAIFLTVAKVRMRPYRLRCSARRPMIASIIENRNLLAV